MRAGKNMSKALRTSLISAAFATVMTVSAAAASSGAGVVNASSLNLRQGADLSAEIRTVIPGGSFVVIAEKLDDWYKLVYNGAVGYASAEYISFYEELNGDFGRGVVRGEGVRMREGPGFDGEVAAYYDDGASASVVGVYGQWYKVNIGGSVGYIHSDYFGLRGEIPPPADEGRRIADTAMKYLGSPYVWGGTSPSGFDCSGLVYYVYKECGYSINRTAESIYQNGEYVAKSDLKPGDAICFANGGGIGHVGIYIGGGRFIHSSSSNEGVIITDLDTAYYTSGYYGARRIV